MNNQQTQGVPVTISPSGLVGPGPRRRRGRLVVAGLAVLAMLLAGGWFVLRSGSGTTATADDAALATPVAGVPATTDSPGTATATAGPSDNPSATAGPADATGPAPKLVGRQLADASGLLPPSVRLDTEDTVDDKATDGTILSQDPAPGAPMNGAMKVTVARQPVLTYLDSLEPVLNNWNYQQAMALSGKVYPHSVGDDVTACYPSQEVEYNISRGYRKLVFTAGLDDDSRDDSLKLQLEIFADGRRVSNTSLQYGKATPITVDVTGVLRLKFQWQPVGAGSGSCERDGVVLGTGRLLGLPGEVPQSTDSPTDDPSADTGVGSTDDPVPDPTG